MKKVKKDIMGFTKASMGLGVGVRITASLPATGVAGFSPSAGLGTMGSMMRPMGMAMMGKHTLRMLGKYPKKRRG